MAIVTGLLAAVTLSGLGCAYEGAPVRAPVRIEAPSDTFDEKAFTAETSTALDAAFAEVVEKSGTTSLQVTVYRPGTGLWSAGHGIEPGRTPFWASVGKTFIAVTIMQLAEEGELSLDDPVVRWFPDLPDAQRMTVRDLLAHTAGLPSANESEEFRALGRALTLDEELGFVAEEGLLFCPGSMWRYSNTGYALLGAIIERTTGQPWRAAIADRVIDPLALDRTFPVETDRIEALVPAASGHGAPVPLDAPGAAGAIAADGADMVRFWHALLTGDLVSTASRDAMFAKLYPMFDNGSYYGLGTMVVDVPDGSGRTLVGHFGGMPGLGALVAWSPRDRAYIAVALSGNGDLSGAVANAMLRSLPGERSTTDPARQN